jgi:hypothetical protein
MIGTTAALALPSVGGRGGGSVELRLVCDSYVGLDQQQVVEVELTEA